MEETTVNIFGVEIKMRHNTPEERFRRVVKMVDEMLKNTQERFKDLSARKVAILVSLELANRLEEAKEGIDRLLGKIEKEIE